MALPEVYVQLPLFAVSKTCRSCHIEHPLECFNANRGSRDGLQTICRVCQGRAFKEWYERNHEQQLERSRSYYHAHRAEVLAQKAAYYEAHPEQMRAQGRESGKRQRERHPERLKARKKAAYQRDKEKVRAHQAAYRAANAAQLRAWDRERYHGDAGRKASTKARSARWRQRSPERMQMHRQRWDAAHPDVLYARRKLRRVRQRLAPGSHTLADVLTLYRAQDGRCAYCHADLAEHYHVDHKQPLSRGGSNSPDNLAIACVRCNLRKHDRTEAEFRALLASEVARTQPVIPR